MLVTVGFIISEKKERSTAVGAEKELGVNKITSVLASSEPGT